MLSGWVGGAAWSRYCEERSLNVEDRVIRPEERGREEETEEEENKRGGGQYVCNTSAAY